MTLNCLNPNEQLDTDWSTQLDIACHHNGSYGWVARWPACRSPPKCGVPPVPSTISGLVLENADEVENKNMSASEKAVYFCKNGAFVLPDGKKLTITCQPGQVYGTAAFDTPGTYHKMN